jgi:hypothetical protein
MSVMSLLLPSPDPGPWAPVWAPVAPMKCSERRERKGCDQTASLVGERFGPLVASAFEDCLKRGSRRGVLHLHDESGSGCVAISAAAFRPHTLV